MPYGPTPPPPKFSFEKLWGTLRFRLTLWYTFLLVTALLVSLLIVRYATHTTLLQDTDQRLREDWIELSQVILTNYPEQIAEIRIEFDRKATAHDTHGMFIHLADAQGQVFLKNVHAPLEKLPFAILNQDEVTRIYSALDHTNIDTTNDVRIVQGTIQLSSGPVLQLRIGTALDLINRDVNQITKILLMIGSIMVILGPLLGYVMASRVTEPIRSINRIVPKLQPQRLTDRLPIRGTGDELDILSQQTNDLLDRIAVFVEKNQRFTANAAHELRSPLAAIQNSVEVALNEDRSVTEYQELLDTVVHECSLLRTLVNQLLQLAENETGLSQVNFQAVELAELIERSVAMFQATAEDQGITITTRLIPCQVWGDPKRIRQIINNLLDNAIKFHREHGRIEITLEPVPDTNYLRFSVKDDGPGIAAEDLPFIFDRFYRADKSHSRENAPGTGLGLSICQAIVNLHGGQIEVQSTLGQGTLFVVTLPRAKSTETTQSSENLNLN
jgi:two-component system, OmpR family, heavy metal sensor histidine kinase CusS